MLDGMSEVKLGLWSYVTLPRHFSLEFLEEIESGNECKYTLDTWNWTQQSVENREISHSLLVVGRSSLSLNMDMKIVLTSILFAFASTTGFFGFECIRIIFTLTLLSHISMQAIVTKLVFYREITEADKARLTETNYVALRRGGKHIQEEFLIIRVLGRVDMEFLTLDQIKAAMIGKLGYKVESNRYQFLRNLLFIIKISLFKL